MPAFDLSSLGNAFLYLTAFMGAFLAALWLSLVFWAYRDSRRRSDDRLAHILSALVVAVLGPPGLVIYLILRPERTMDEAYQHSLEEEALLSTIETGSTCPGCSSHTKPSWQICPNCHTRLRKPCSHCGELMELSWQVCPHCANPAPGARLQVDAPPEADEAEPATPYV